ncbi:hypothetical protein HMH01_12330 [Halovulum dunhuangense]|uniref:PBP domain-containing protein n=1 Tax=Halovulum dunhuangense TaxID=1505036 RepID=A0A849L4N9_9RHOB|nr:substrate-binding domain-containing protein [Halovulum dunhuangense]NNU81223.1 hypothetical protein [Halovulum dunhuangense]
MTRMTRINTALFLSALAAQGAAAQQVELSSPDGNTSFAGELVAFDGDTYTLRTALGTLAFPAGSVICRGDACPVAATGAATSFRIVGAPGLLRFAVPELIDAYSLTVDTDIERDRTDAGDLVFGLLSFTGDPLVDITLDEADAEAAVAALDAGEATLAILPRPLSDAELGRIGPGVGERMIARTAALAFVGRDVGLDVLSMDALAGIFSGQITNWAELGGPDMTIDAFAADPASETMSVFRERVLAPRGLALGANVTILDVPGAAEATLEEFPAGIALSGFDTEEGAIAISDACGRPVPPTPFSVKADLYPLSGALYAYTAPGDLPVHAERLLSFALSPVGQSLLPATGFVDTLPQLEGGDAMADRGAATGGARRLSSHFDVLDGPDPLGPQGVVDLERLVGYVTTPGAEAEEIIFVSLGDTAAARDVAGTMFDAYPAVEEDLTLAFRITAAPAEACEREGREGTPVEIWTRPLGEG